MMDCIRPERLNYPMNTLDASGTVCEGVKVMLHTAEVKITLNKNTRDPTLSLLVIAQDPGRFKMRKLVLRIQEGHDESNRIVKQSMRYAKRLIFLPEVQSFYALDLGFFLGFLGYLACRH